MNSIYVDVDPSLVDVVPRIHDGYPEAKAALDTPAAMRAAFGDKGRDFPSAWYVKPADLKDRAAENDKFGLWAENYWDRFTNQNPTHECTGHALMAVLESCWNRQRRCNFAELVVGNRQKESAKGSVWFSVNSVYAQANPGQWGGANCQQMIGIACERGVLPDFIQPRDYGFRHTMWGTAGKGGVNQSTGQWPGWSRETFIRHPSGWADENWRETAKHFMPLEVVNPQSEEEYDSCLINGGAIGIGRSGHSVAVGRIVWDKNGRKLYRYKDSYDRFLYDSRPYTGGAYCVLTMKQPDDPNFPAGK